MRSHPREKLGRNDPCSCGSGKKYKSCCLAIESLRQSEGTPWHQQRLASDRLSNRMLQFAGRKFAGHYDEVWVEFNQTQYAKPLGSYPNEGQIFYPYFLFDWDPERPGHSRTKRKYPGAVARAFIAEYGNQLDELESRVLLESISRPLSFYETVACTPGHGLKLRDVLTGEEHEVEEHAGSQHLRVGDIVYAQICQLPNVTVLSRMAPTAIPPRRKASIIGLRAKLNKRIAKQNRTLSSQDLIRYAETIRTVYLDLRDAIYAPPRLTNTDGDPLLLHTLTYNIGSAQVAFDALAPLASGCTREELLADAEIDGQGILRRASISWIKRGNKVHASWDNTILGTLVIDGRTLTVEVNSANRAEKIHKEIGKRLGMLAAHKETRTQSVEAPPAGAIMRNTGIHARGPDSQVPLEVLEQYRQMMQDQVDAWIYQKIPALGGRTPLEAVKDTDGREMVQALLTDWERMHETSASSPQYTPDLRNIRKLLKL